MKFWITTLLFSVALESAGQKLLLGPFLGGQVSQPMYDDKSYEDRYQPAWMPGFQAGMSSVWLASEKFALAHDLYYTQVGKKISGDAGLTQFTEYHQQLGTSVVFRVILGDKRFKYYAGVGPNVRYWLRSNGMANLPELFEIYETNDPLRYTLRMSDGQVSNREVFFITEPNRFQLGIDFNAGVLIPMKRQWLGVDFRYVWGHTNMAKPESTYTSFAFFEDNLEHTHHSVQVSLSYLFSFDLFEITHKGKRTNKKER
ncbi:MAG: hypothetical protein AAF632_20375 [Bacteroidota bacterium]